MADHNNIHLALAHFPVYNKKNEIVTSSVTTLDVHDISRACKTYEVASFYVVTPLATQQRLVERILNHWRTGYGAEYNPTRMTALMKTRVQDSLDAVAADIEAQCGEKPQTIVTDARIFPRHRDYAEMREILAQPKPFLLIFGTGWGLERGIIDRADYVLSPIEGRNGYNHLPVRGAVAIILDRLLGKR